MAEIISHQKKPCYGFKTCGDKLIFDHEGCEIWWKKNRNENYAKFNLYISDTLLPHEVIGGLE